MPKVYLFYESSKYIAQNEDARYKMQKGREVHKYKELTNIDYLRKKIEVKEKLKKQVIYSKKYNINWKVDETLTFKNFIMGALDYKFAEYKEKTLSTYRTQLIMYSVMIEDNFGDKVDRGYLV